MLRFHSSKPEIVANRFKHSLFHWFKSDYWTIFPLLLAKSEFILRLNDVVRAIAPDLTHSDKANITWVTPREQSQFSEKYACLCCKVRVTPVERVSQFLKKACRLQPLRIVFAITIGWARMPRCWSWAGPQTGHPPLHSAEPEYCEPSKCSKCCNL